MNNLLLWFKKWLESSSKKQKQNAALYAFGALSTFVLFVLRGASSSTSDTLESTPLYFAGVFLKLIVVLLLIVASAVIFRRWSQNGLTGKKTRQVKLLETVRLSPKQALHLVSVGDQHLLVGATDQGISLLTQVEVDLNVVETELPKAQPGTDFTLLLQTLNLHSSDASYK
jgi:flagellar biosynthetic protein FliO